jgi:hypothetical protein
MRTKKITAAYTVNHIDDGFLLGLSGSAFYAVTFSSSAPYADDFRVELINCDTNNGKTITVGSESFILWPCQRAVVQRLYGMMYVDRNPYWRHPGGVFNVYTNFNTGSDSNDGLNPSTPFKTVNGALYRIFNDVAFRSTAGGQTQLVINMADNVTDTQSVHFSAHSVVGAQGGAAVKIKGGTNSEIRTASGEAVGIYCNGMIQIENVKMTCDAGAALSVGYGALVDLLGGNSFGASNSHMNVADTGAQIKIGQSYEIHGGAVQHMCAQNGGVIQVTNSSITAKFMADCNFSYRFATASTGGILSVPNMTFDLNGHTVTGSRYLVVDSGLIYTGTSGDINYFPGDAAGAILPAGVYR